MTTKIFIIIFSFLLLLLSVFALKKINDYESGKTKKKIFNHWYSIPSTNKVGYRDMNCPKKGSFNPRVWGPPTWYTLHLMGENYPKKPNKEHIKACHNFMTGLPYMLPCGECGYHLKEFEKGMNYKKECGSRKNLRKFLLKAHNNINKHEKKPIWNVTEVEDQYSSVPFCETDNSTWPSKKSLDDS